MEEAYLCPCGYNVWILTDSRMECAKCGFSFTREMLTLPARGFNSVVEAVGVYIEEGQEEE